MDKYRNRKEAGKILANELKAYANRGDVIVLALPRGGVPVGFEIAKELMVPLDVFLVRKLGVPGHSELAMGAIAIGDSYVFNEDIVGSLHIPKSAIEAVIEEEKAELKRRERAYRGEQPFPSLKDKTVILVDDGIATGATMRAAVKALKQLEPASLIMAVPVADKSVCDLMRPLVDRFICPMQPHGLYAVGAWYDDFSQTEDDEVHSLLEQARKFSQHYQNQS